VSVGSAVLAALLLASMVNAQQLPDPEASTEKPSIVRLKPAPTSETVGDPSLGERLSDGGEFYVAQPLPSQNAVFRVIGSSGNVGIGVVGSLVPSFALDVQRDASTSIIAATGYGQGFTGNFIGRSARNIQASPQETLSEDYLAIFGGRGYNGTSFNTASSARMTVKAEQNFTSAGAAGYITFDTVPQGSTVLAERMRIDSAGNLGIGSPAAIGIGLHLTRDNIALVRAESRGSYSAGYFSANNIRSWFVGTGATGLFGDTGHFIIQDSTQAVNRVDIDDQGNVGIGMSPAMKLDVNGAIRSTGAISTSGTLTAAGASISGNVTATGTISGHRVVATYQDVAEWVPADADLPAGTVVALRSDRSNEVTESQSAYDTRVAGVVSAEPGVILGEAGAHKVIVATTGRVRVKVDASLHAITVGDLLVTSDLAGVAMRSEAMMINGRSFHQPGTIIGKALEPLSAGEGQILVLLSLQ